MRLSHLIGSGPAADATMNHRNGKQQGGDSGHLLLSLRVLGRQGDVNFPEAWTERLPFLEPLEESWRPDPMAALIVACAFYGLFLWQAARRSGPLLMIDLVFIPVHEGGHLLFRLFGEFLMVAGGTLLQLGAPLMLAAVFIFQRQIQGTVFCVFFFFEQFLPIATYMADARAQELPLLTVGDSDDVIHDWNYLFDRLGLLDHDTQIAHAVRVIGWIGMFATVGWMIWRSVQSRKISLG
jgi:hypothetical protein